MITSDCTLFSCHHSGWVSALICCHSDNLKLVDCRVAFTPKWRKCSWMLEPSIVNKSSSVVHGTTNTCSTLCNKEKSKVRTSDPDVVLSTFPTSNKSLLMLAWIWTNVCFINKAPWSLQEMCLILRRARKSTVANKQNQDTVRIEHFVI